MGLTLNEKKLLIIHKLLFDRIYVPSKSEQERVHSAIYLCQNMNVPISNGFGFNWYYECIYSEFLDYILERMNSKQDDIINFSSNPDFKKEDFWNEGQINNLLSIHFVLSSQEDKDFIIILCNLLFMYKNLALLSFDKAVEELKRRTSLLESGKKYNNNSLLQDAWNCLGLLDLVQVKDDGDFKVLRRLLDKTLAKHRE